MSLAAISRDLSASVDRLRFQGPAATPVAFVYNPLAYARGPHEAYLAKWGAAPKEALFLGMNPGPFGMAQTGVPFGDPALVRDFLGITGLVSKPKKEHPARPIVGMDSPRSEVSGARFWGWAKARFVTADAFFKRFFVVNYCPLLFMEGGGKNLTPDKLTPKERAALYAPCDEALRRIVATLKPSHVIGIGAFAEKRAAEALDGLPITIGTVLHPSPASPLANRGWAEAAEAGLRKQGVAIP